MEKANDSWVFENFWVFENTEVVMTGRKAKKTMRSGKDDILYEITPRHTTSGSWKKWADLNQMYQIINENDD